MKSGTLKDTFQFKRLIKYRTEFSAWTLEDKDLTAEDKTKTADEKADLTEKLITGSDVTLLFEKLLLFELVKFICQDNRQFDYYHIKYLQQYICKPFKWTMVQYISCVCKMFDYCVYCQLPTTRGKTWEDSEWATVGTSAQEKKRLRSN